MSAVRAEAVGAPGQADLSVTPMRRRHLRGVLRIEQQVYPRPWSYGLYLGELAHRGGSRSYVVARSGHRVVGYGGLMVVGDDAHITTLAVDPELHGQRLGTRLLLVLARLARQQGIEGLTLEVRMSNEPGKALYRRFGFAPAGIRKNYYAEVNEDALVMWAHDIDTEAYGHRLDEVEASLPWPTPLVGFTDPASGLHGAPDEEAP
jgi:ribosomal-protein-alanine N-acetyltransferase